MAQIRETTIWNLPHSIERAEAKPLDSTEIWLPTYDKNTNTPTRAYNRALAYAQSDKTTSYVGQIVCVLEGTIDGGTGTIDYRGIQPKYYSIYLDNNGKGALCDLVPEIELPEIPEKYENYEINYETGLISTDEGSVIVAVNYFKKGSSTLFINGIQYNNSEYEEGCYGNGKFSSTSATLNNEPYCNAIRFTKFELNPGTVFGNNKSNDGDEILISAVYYKPSNQ